MKQPNRKFSPLDDITRWAGFRTETHKFRRWNGIECNANASNDMNTRKLYVLAYIVCECYDNTKTFRGISPDYSFNKSTL